MGGIAARWGIATALALACLVAPRVAAEPLERVRFRHYGVEDGLSHPTARVILQDRTGFIWIGTQNGLNRFDGYEFRKFMGDARDPDALHDSSVTALADDGGDGVWVGTLAGGLARYSPRTARFRNYRAQPGGLASDAVTALARDANGDIWIGSGDSQLQRLDRNGDRFDQPAGVGSIDIGATRMILPLRDGSLLVAGSRGLWSVDVVAGRSTEWRPQDGRAINALSMAQATSGEIAVGTSSLGVIHFNPLGEEVARSTMADGLADSTARALLFDPQGRLWVGTNDGLSRLDRRGGEPRTWRFGTQQGGLSSGRVQTLMHDREGILWVGTWLNGASLFDPRTEGIAELRSESTDGITLPGTAVPGLFVDTDGSVWLGVLESGGLVHFDMQKGVLRRYAPQPDVPGGLPNSVVSQIARDRNGRLWVPTQGGGLAYLDPGSEVFGVLRHDPQDPASLPGDSIQRVLLTRTGDLWVGTLESGVAMRCARCPGFRRFGAEELGGPSVNALFEDSAGHVWIGLRPGGLVRYKPETAMLEHWLADSRKAGTLSHSGVSVVTEDSKGRLWLGTQGGGINRVVLGPGRVVERFESFAARDGLVGDAIGGILEDGSGLLWVSTIGGLSRFDPESRKVVNFGTSEGAQQSGYFIGAYDRLPDGRLLFGGLRGVTVLEPASARKIDMAPAVVITRSIAGQRDSADGVGDRLAVTRTADGGTELRLRPGVNDLVFEISALRYAAPLELHYAYRLDGHDQDWVETSTRRRLAMYSNLPPGDYLFRARARYREGAWGAELRLPVKLLTPWYQTTLVRSLIIAALLVLLLLPLWLVRQRLRERERAANELAHSEDRLRRALNGTGDELWDADLRVGGGIERINPIGHIKPSQDSFELSFESFSAAIHPDDRQLFMQALRQHIKGEAPVFECVYRLERIDEGWSWLRSRGRVSGRDGNGIAIRLTGTTEDITALKESELALQRLNEELDQRVSARTADLTEANESLNITIDELHMAESQLVQSEKLAALGGLVAGVAHEINTPLGIGVTAASHLEHETQRFNRKLQAGVDDPAAFEQYRQVALETSQLILRNLRRADRLVRSFKQVAVDQVSEARRRIDLGAYIEEIMLSLKPALKKTGHVVEQDTTTGLWMDTYPGALYQVISNLTMNSVQHAFEPGQSGTIRIHARRQGEQVVIEYSDNGRGMDAETRRRLFEPFFTTRRGSGGSGLGMHIAWNLTSQILGGEIECASAPGRGVIFTLRLPLSSPLSASPAEGAAISREAARADAPLPASSPAGYPPASDRT